MLQKSTLNGNKSHLNHFIQLYLKYALDMKVKDVTNYLETIAPLQLQEEYDNAGLIIGNGDNQIKGVLICLDVTDEVLNEAINTNCNLIIAHHPLIFRV